MAADLEKELSELHSCLQEGGQSGNARANEIVGNIAHICLEDINEKDVDFCCSALFGKDDGVVSFLRKIVQQEEYQGTKADLMDFLLAFMKKHERKLIPYSVDIKEACMSLFTRDRFAKVKNSALPLLIELVQQTSGSKVVEDLNIQKMMDKFFMELTNVSKHSATVKQNIYHLLGVVSEAYPELVINYSERLFGIYIQTLKSQMTSKTKKPEMSLIAGSLQGLSHLLVHFTQSAEEGAKHSYDIYRYTRNAIVTDTPLSRYEMPRAALQLLSRHSSQFGQYLLDEYQDIYGRLTYWTNHNNRDMQHLGMSATESFFKQISSMLVSHAKEGRKDGAVFKFFVQEFKKIMDNPDSTGKEISLAIRGYGFFAAPCKMFLTTNDVKFMFNEMIQRSEQVYFSPTDNIEDKVIGLPNFLEALASIILELEEISDTFLLSVEKLVVLLMENFPKLSKKLYPVCFFSILKVCFSLAPKGAVFKGFLSRIVYQGLLRTCSHPVFVATEEDGEEEEVIMASRKQRISYRDYITMWQTLLNPSHMKSLSSLNISLKERKAFTEAVYDELLSSVLHVIERLDLHSNKNNTEGSVTEGSPGPSSAADDVVEGTTSDPAYGLHAAKPKDFIIFINVVEFCRDLLPGCQTELFNKWVFTFGHQLILYSTQFPLVSGFYKLLAVCMKISSTTRYFKGLGGPTLAGQALSSGAVAVKLEIKQEPGMSQTDSMEVDPQPGGDSLVQREACFMLFSKFTKEVLVRLQQYKDDLLSACLSFILSLPREVVISELAAIVPALQTAFQIGRSYLPLAHAGLDALDLWSRSLPPAVIGPYYKDILQYLDPYLKSGTDTGTVAADSTITMTSLNTTSSKSKRKIPIKLLKKANIGKETKMSHQTQLMDVRQRCVHLLGSLGGSVNNVMVSSSAEELARSAVAWDSTKRLKFDMPFMDIKPTIYFDPFLPHVVELATTSSDRQIKVAACELLHSLVLYMLGRSTQQPETQRAAAGQENMDALYRKLFPVVVQLACDVEQVARQLFEPLVMQLIHWFTSGKMFGSMGTQILLQTVMDGLVSPTDTALRDFCAVCLKEYLSWSIKQTSKEQMEKSLKNVKMLVKSLFGLARHPSAFKRLGAALGFNNIYTVFREEESLVDMFIFEMLVVYIESLAIAHQDDKSLGTQEQTKLALTHIEKIVKKKAANLCKPSEKRIKPKEWLDANLQTCTRWLIRQCGRPQTECRHACMQLVCNLAASIPGVTQPKDLFDALMKDSGGFYFIQRFEVGLYKSSLGRQGIAKRPTLTDMGDSFSLKCALGWFDMVLATLDCYCWAFGAKLLTPGKTLNVTGNKGTVLFKVLGYFLDTLALSGIDAAADLFDKTRDTKIFTPRERDDYNRSKCTVVVRIMDFLVILLKNYKDESLKVIPAAFWSTNLWKVFICCVLQPSKLGFNMANVDVLSNLPQQTLQMLMMVSRYLPDNTKKGFYQELSSCSSDSGPCALFTKLPSSLDDASLEYLELSHLVRGYQQLHQTRLMDGATKKGTKTDKLACLLLDSVFKGIVTHIDGRPTALTLTPTSTDLGCELLKLSFIMGLPNSELLSVLLDKSPLRNATSHSTSPHGTLFYALFKTTINSHLVANTDKFLANLMVHVRAEWTLVGNVLTGMLDQIGKDRELRKKFGPGMTDAILHNWKHLAPWWEGAASTTEMKTLALSLLTKIILIDGKAVTNTKHPAFSTVYEMYLSMLVDKETSLAFKSRVMDILAFFCTLPEKETRKLKSKLDRLVTDKFPAHSSEYLVGGPKYNNYIAALNKILTALELSGSLMLLELLISIICKEERHVYEDEIQDTIARYVRRLPMDKQKPALDVGYDIFTQEGSFKNSQRRSALGRVCLSMLRLVQIPALKEFFVDHIKEIMKIIEAKPVKTPETAFETQLVSKLCCFELLEVMYSRLKKEDVRSKDSLINQKYCSPSTSNEGKEMTLAITKAAQAAKFEDIRGETVLIDLRRQYHCSAYNTLIAVVSCTQTELRFYVGLLFQEDVSKREILWENLIDTKKDYSFPIEMDNPIARRKKFVAIRNEVREGEDDDLDTTSVRYLTSQYLADSSLSVEVSQFDFNTSVQASAFGTASVSSLSDDPRAKRRRHGSKQSSDLQNLLSSENETEVTVRGDYVEMEMDELNQHECMASMTAVIRHMARNEITPVVPKGEAPASMPKWMDNIHRKIQSHTTPLNVRLFFIKLIINTEEVFRPYTRFWLGPLVQIITRGDLGVEGINYFMTDLVVILLSWHTVAIPEDTPVDRSMASRLLEVLTSRCYHDARQVLKNNLEILKTLVEVWKTRIDIPTKVLYDNFTDKDPKSKRNVAGIQMTGVILANRLAPCPRGCGIDKDKFYKFLAMNMLNNYKQVYSSSAEVVGMALKLMSETERGEDHQHWRDQYIDNISHMLLGFQETKPDLFIYCVHRLQLHYPAIADRFLSKVLFMLPKVYGVFKTHCLEILQSRVNSVEDVFIEMKNKNILGILSYRDELAQHSALGLVKGMLSYLKPDQLLYLLPSVTSFTTSHSTLCRSVMYEILMWIYDNYRNEDNPSAHDILRLTKESLLCGLSDDDLKNRLTIQNFWSHETRLPVGTLDRLVAMLEAMYSPATENQYLSYATNLLMEMTSKSPDYNRQIFEHPLSECKFEDYRVSHSWRQRHVNMTPLFVETQMTQAGDSGSPQEGATVIATQVRATQDVQQFTATQHDAGGRPYNWLTQSSMDTFSDTSLTLATETQSALLFTVGSGGSKGAGTSGSARAAPGRTGRPVGAGFAKDRILIKSDRSDQEQQSQSSEILRLKRRFIKDTRAKSEFFAKQEARKKKVREEIMREQRQKREHEVTMYRKYRIGDLPDIQIQYSYIIAPLQALAQKDSTVARILFSSIFKAIFAQLEHVKTDRECTETTKQIQDSMNEMLSTSTQYYPPFVSCLLDIAYKYPKKLVLQPTAIGTACVTSLQQPLGVALLEETLIQTDSSADERPSKRAKVMASAHVSTEVSTWLEVARLYKSLGDYDVLQGIFSKQLGIQKLTSEAMEAEMRGDYLAAIKLYSDGLERDDWEDRPDEAEMDLWDAGRLQCYDNLTQWERLEQCTLNNIDDANPPRLDKIWADTYFQDVYLPHLLRSKLKLLQEQGEGQEDLGTFIDEAMKIPERKAMLEIKYTEELALLYMWQEEYDRASYYVSSAIQLFLQDWSSIDDLMTNSRSSRLQSLQKLNEMDEFLKFIRTESNFSSYQPATWLLDKWIRRSPDPIVETIGVWDDIIANRCMYVDHIIQKLEAQTKMDVEGDVGTFDHHKVVLKLAQAESAIQQDNFPVAMKQLKHSIPIMNSLGDEKLQIRWTHTYARSHHRKGQVEDVGVKEKLKALLATLDTLNKHTKSGVLQSDIDLKRNQHLLLGQSLYQIISNFQHDLFDQGTIGDDVLSKIKAIVNSKKQSFDQLVNSLIEEGYNQTKMAVRLSADRGGHTEGTKDAHMALVKYCDTFLRQKEDDEKSPVDPASVDAFPNAVIMSLLEAMKLNSAEACQMFPRLLQLVEMYPDTMGIFIKKCTDVPCWMFLSWVSQITALLDKRESPAVQNILLSIAQEYPQALVYPFKMSCDGYQFTNDSLGKKSKIVKDRLADLLSKNKLVDKFIWALEQFGQPNAIFKDWFTDTELQRLLANPKKNSSRIQAMFQDMFDQLLDTSRASEDDLYDESLPGTQSQSVLPPVGMGPYRKKFAKLFAREVMQKFGKDGSKMLHLNIKQFMTDAKSIFNKMEGEVSGKRGNMHPPETMKEYSEWLSDFQGCDQDYELEIPGQYTGDKKPLPDYHTKISSFGEQVKVMTSIRKPKRILIYGNDQKEYLFLVKGGEDLRQDQRIEQLFVIMNHVFARDSMCRQRKLLLRTYQVIPMTPRVGLIEWMKQTIPLKEFLYSNMTDLETQFNISKKGPKAVYGQFLGSDVLNDAKLYLNTYKNINRASTATNFKMRESLIPWDLSRRAYQNMSTSPEAFFTLRNNFATSHGQLSICQYILGIGDRHLSNFMIDLENGKSVGIDFGHAFGSATQFLQAPELMPFRLTRQIRNLVMPLREKGLMQGTMVHALRALRKNSQLLLNTMDVFIKEPSLDWKQFAGKQIKTMECSAEDIEELTTDLEWYPRQKVAYARRKLDGHNPAHITRDELRLGHGKNYYFAKAEKVIMGEKEFDIRARVGAKNLSVEQQVACLINQATDPNILGRVYFGWEPWV